ncbi:MAG: DUF4412 domain-containing protein [Candidatus Dadabacteria bacterium]|nr:DUF4412 domain-containing protein [Candidatus Dadabacteria bacterium]NIS10278.1 DUF4412 domain-containing protein [Candidatus Dadabacteria bacterium]NIY23204.1 DUF4412 domain-containing protein [Candidatus Dadabacteria bacterium]
MNKNILLGFFVLVFALTTDGFSDAVVKMEYKDNFSNTVNNNTNSFKGSDMRMDFYEGGEQITTTMIFKGDKDEMINLDHKSRSYYVMDKQTLEAFATQMNAAMAELEKQMANMSPEEKAMMEQMMKGKMPSMNKTEEIEPVLKKAGSDKVSGYSCTRYEVYKGSEKVRELCVTNWANIEGGSEIKSSILSMTNFMEDLSKSMSEVSGFMANTANFEKNVFNQINKLNGLPVQTTDYSNGKVTGVSTFKSSKKTSLEASVFAPPANYKLQKIRM